MSVITTPAGRPLEAAGSQSLVLLVQYTRQRRSADELAILETDPSLKRVYVSQYEQATQGMNNVTIKALRSGYDLDMLIWLVQGATDRQLMEIDCRATNNDQVVALINSMRAQA